MTALAEERVVTVGRGAVAGQPVRIDGVRHVYRSSAGDVAALSGIDLEIEAGEVVTVVGPS